MEISVGMIILMEETKVPALGESDKKRNCLANAKRLISNRAVACTIFFFFPEMDRIPSGMYFVQRERMGQPPSSKVKNNPAIYS